MRRDFMEEKQKDVAEIRRLTNVAIATNLSVTERMQSQVQTSDGVVMESTAYWGDVGKLL
jgi:hypothetical protein